MPASGYCDQHISLAEKVAKSEVKINVVCEQQTTIFGKMDGLTAQLAEVIKGKMSRGTVIAIVALTNTTVGLAIWLLTH